MQNNNLLASKILEIAPELKPIIKTSYNYKKSYKDWIIQNINYYILIVVLSLSTSSCILNFFRNNYIIYQALQVSFILMITFVLISIVTERRHGYWKLVDRECRYIRSV